MPRKYIIVLALLVIVPILAFYLLGRRLVEADQLRTQQQFETLLEANLSGIDRTIADFFATTQQRLLVADIDPNDEDSIRHFVRSEPLVEQVLLIGQDGTPVYLDSSDPYLGKVEQLIADRTFVRSSLREQIRQVKQQTKTTQTISRIGNRPVKVIIHPNEPAFNTARNPPATNQGYGANGYAEPSSNSQDYGWYTWYFASGAQLMHWQVLEDNRTLVVGLKRARWMAEVISILPDSDPNSQNRTSPSQIRLIDATGDIVYLWGANTSLPKTAKPVSELHLSSPLRSWQLQHFGPSKPFSFGRSATLINLLGTGGILFLGLLGLVLFLAREIGRQTREARQRVNFVNQVSHELKTPLTNIRMYADLLENDLERIEPDDPKAQSHLSVITDESSRLSRLINNVLTFARTNRNAKQPMRQPHSVDKIIQQVIEQFRPSLEQLEIKLALDLDAPQTVSMDADTFEQMLGNLISNVEKYAADGKHLRVASRHARGETTVTISDAGPGIEAAFAKRIFDPFERASDQIVSAAGTGIGLSIARTLAQRHGGDLVLVDSSMGATFRLTLRTPLCEN